MSTKVLRPGEREQRWVYFHAFVVLALVCYSMLWYIARDRMTDLYYAYGTVAVTAAFSLLAYRTLLDGSWLQGVREVLPLGLYALWMFVSRLLLGDFYLFVDRGYLFIAMILCLLFSSGFLFEAEKRRVFLNWFCGFTIAYYFLLSAASVFIALTNTYIHLPPENSWITIRLYRESQDIYALNLFVHRNSAASWLYIALSLSVYEFFSCRRKLWRVPALIAGFVIFCAIALAHCRTINVALAVSFGMLALLLCLRFVRISKKALLVPVLAVVTALSMLLSYKSIDLTLSAITSLSNVTAPAFARSYSASEHQLDPEYFGIALSHGEPDESAQTESGDDSPASVDFSETRSFGGNLMTLTGRTGIWKTIIPAIKAEPYRAFAGKLSNHYMDYTWSCFNWTPGHMHNAFLQCLMLFGAPAMLFILVFTVLLVYHMIRYYFCGRLFRVKLLTIPLAGLLVYSIMESSLFTSFDVPMNSFFLIAGVFLAHYYEQFPNTKT